MQSFDDYQEFAEAYVKDTESNSHNAYYERPAMFSVLEKLKFNKVLDAGCAGGDIFPMVVTMRCRCCGDQYQSSDGRVN